MRSPNSLKWLELSRLELQEAREKREAEKAKICRHTAQMRLQKKLLAVRRSQKAA